MAFLALFTGTLFWLVVFFCLMASAYVLFRDGFGYKGALEAASLPGAHGCRGAAAAHGGAPAERAGDGGLGGGGLGGRGCRRWGALDVAATPTTGSGPAVGGGARRYLHSIPRGFLPHWASPLSSTPPGTPHVLAARLRRGCRGGGAAGGCFKGWP